jgi:hypothetical protein
MNEDFEYKFWGRFKLSILAGKLNDVDMGQITSPSSQRKSMSGPMERRKAGDALRSKSNDKKIPIL